jgi:cob(I)alamin adenosyltransferase
MKGLVHIYTGNGKGKTTASIGLGIRAYGRGFKVLMVQFLKGEETGETKTFEKLAPDFMVHRGKVIKKFTWQMTKEELAEFKENQQEVFNYAVEAAASGKWDLLILDEILGAVSCNIISLEDTINLVKSKPDKLELVLTGRNAPGELVDLADYVSDIHAVKHPMEKGVPARKGIEI